MSTIGRTVAAATFVTLVLLTASSGTRAADQGITGKKLLFKSSKLVLLSKDPGISIAGSDPVGGTDSSISFDDGSGPVTVSLPKTLWSTNGATTLFKYKNASAPSGPSLVKVAKVKSGLLKVIGKGAPFAVPTGAATVTVVFNLDGGTNRYCLSFSGTGDGNKYLVKDATAGSCSPPPPTPTATATVTATATETATVTPTETPTACPGGGEGIAGSCWYLGAEGASCDATCAGVGSFCGPATLSYVGSEGTSDNCGAILTALGVMDPYIGDASCGPQGVGCSTQPGVNSLRCIDTPTSCAAVNFVDRVCSCGCPNGGEPVGGFCWYLGALGASCDATCLGLGMTCSAGTTSYAGTGGTAAQCMAVMAALAGHTFTGDFFAGGAGGCQDADIPGASFRDVQTTTTCGAPGQVSVPFSEQTKRACACE